MKTIANLPEFLAHLGASTPYQAGRALYKSTPCGPWISFIVTKSPAASGSFRFSVALDSGRLIARVEETPWDDPADIVRRTLEIFGFDPDTLRCVLPGRHSLKSYAAKAREFLAGHPTPGPATSATLHEHGHPDGEYIPRPRALWVTVGYTTPTVTGSVYYEDQAAGAMIPDCIGVQVGSIVEGSEAYVDRDPLFFPFPADRFDELVEDIDKEASFYWRRDNLDSYQVTTKSGREFWFDHGWGEALPKEIPAALRRKVSAFLATSELEEGDEAPIPGTRATIARIDKSDFIF